MTRGSVTGPRHPHCFDTNLHPFSPSPLSLSPSLPLHRHIHSPSLHSSLFFSSFCAAAVACDVRVPSRPPPHSLLVTRVSTSRVVIVKDPPDVRAKPSLIPPPPFFLCLFFFVSSFQRDVMCSSPSFPLHPPPPRALSLPTPPRPNFLLGHIVITRGRCVNSRSLPGFLMRVVHVAGSRVVFLAFCSRVFAAPCFALTPRSPGVRENAHNPQSKTRVFFRTLEPPVLTRSLQTRRRTLRAHSHKYKAPRPAPPPPPRCHGTDFCGVNHRPNAWVACLTYGSPHCETRIPDRNHHCA